VEAAFYCLAAGFVLLLGNSTHSQGLLALEIFGAGIGAAGSQVALNALLPPTITPPAGPLASVEPMLLAAVARRWAPWLAAISSLLGWPLSMVFAVASIPAS
jgi:hypothetical protein